MRLPIENDHDQVLAWVEGTPAEIDAHLQGLLEVAKRWRDPERRETLERRVLRALSLLNREPGAEHETTQARRRAGGGRLTKGS